MSSRQITNDINLVQSQLGLLRSRVIRIQDLNSSERNQIARPLADMEKKASELHTILDEFESNRKGGSK